MNTKSNKAVRKRTAARHKGKRQTPWPHEHVMMVGWANRPYDPDNDGDNDAADTDNDAPAGGGGAAGGGGTAGP